MSQVGSVWKDARLPTPLREPGVLGSTGLDGKSAPCHRITVHSNSQLLGEARSRSVWEDSDVSRGVCELGMVKT